MRIAFFCRDESDAGHMQELLPCTSDRWEWIVVADITDCNLVEEVEVLLATYHKHVDDKGWETGKADAQSGNIC